MKQGALDLDEDLDDGRNVSAKPAPACLDFSWVPWGRPWGRFDWGERESLYDDSFIWGCHHDSGLCGCDEPVVRVAKTTKEAWELMYFKKNGHWADPLRQEWLDGLTATDLSPAYSPTGPPYSPTSPLRLP